MEQIEWSWQTKWNRRTNQLSSNLINEKDENRIDMIKILGKELNTSAAKYFAEPCRKWSTK